MKLSCSLFLSRVFLAVYLSLDVFGVAQALPNFASVGEVVPNTQLALQRRVDNAKQDNPRRILFVTSNQHFYGKSDIPAANHFEEIVMAYDVFMNHGYRVDIVSPEGGAIPIDYVNTSIPIQKKYLYDENFMNKLERTHRPEELNFADYAAVYYSGGGAAMFGVAENRAIQKLVVSIYENNGVVSAVCHGTAGLVYLAGSDGKSLLDGKNITGYPDAFESKERPYYATFPFKMDHAVQAAGAHFKYSPKWGDKFYIRDGRLITGQDPSSSSLVAKEIVEYLQTNGLASVAQDEKAELDQIRLVLTDYIEGTANGEPDRVRKAFHEDLNLYSIKNDSLEVWKGKTYIANIAAGKINTRQGKIVTIDYEKDVAMAKIEILVPDFRLFTDYLMLAKVKGVWKIVHKSFTSSPVKSN